MIKSQMAECLEEAKALVESCFVDEHGMLAWPHSNEIATIAVALYQERCKHLVLEVHPFNEPASEVGTTTTVGERVGTYNPDAKAWIWERAERSPP